VPASPCSALRQPQPVNFLVLDPRRNRTIRTFFVSGDELPAGLGTGRRLIALSEVVAKRTCRSPASGSPTGLKAKVGSLLVAGNNDPWPDVRDALNGLLFGWSSYFSYGTHRSVFRGIDYYVYERVRDFLARRHKMHGRGTRRFSYDVVHGERGVLRLERLPWSVTPCALR
jgi:hypothetical protein